MSTQEVRKTIPDYEVPLFLDAIFPGGWNNTQVGRVLDVDRITVGRWVQNGMPANKARELIAWKMTSLLPEISMLAGFMAKYGL
jgi:hypothetical protein